MNVLEFERQIEKQLERNDIMNNVGIRSINYGTNEPLSIECVLDWDTMYKAFQYQPHTPKREMKRLPEKYIEGIKKKTGEKSITLFWEDDITTSVVCSKNDKYDKRLGFLIAYFQYNSGLSKTQANKYLDNLVEEVKK